ncbi:MAG: hypothetical protein GY704_16720 [Phycisphaeraceae bacterium]|nr:hypothetical protein [Phycisphaeraceae bacterium]
MSSDPKSVRLTNPTAAEFTATSLFVADWDRILRWDRVDVFPERDVP